MTGSLYHSLAKPPILTVVIGAKCSDGIVLITDAKLTKIVGPSILKSKFGRKLFGDIAHLLIGYTGSEEVFDFFRKYIIGDVELNRDRSECYTADNTITKIASVVEVINRRLGNSLIGDQFAILIAQHRGENSKLYYINKRGKIKELEYKVIGSGATTASKFCRKPYRKKTSMKEFTKAAFCSIMYLDQLPNSTVGVIPDGIPMMRYLRRNRIWDKAPPPTHIEEFQRIVQRELDADNTSLNLLINRIHSRIKFS